MDAVQSSSHADADDEDRHDGPTEHMVEMPLGSIVVQVATAVEKHAETEAERDAAAALAIPYTHGAVAIATTTDRLLTRAEGLVVGIESIPVSCRPTRGARALARWRMLKVKGPADDPLGNWSYMRDLAHIARDMVLALREHRAAAPSRAFVGRADMPPISPDVS